jgi:4-amino-4-deoxy-L-arabinose transferase-like glycosyltransferase
LGRLRRYAPLAIVVLALAIRIAVVAADTGYQPTDDAFEYDYYARSIAQGEGFTRSGYLKQGGPTAIRGPAYPYLLGFTYTLSGESTTAGRLLNAVLGALTVALIFALGSRIWGFPVGLVAAFFAAVFPPLVLLSRDLVSESLFLPLELLAVLCMLNFRRAGGSASWAAATGVALGAAILTRNTGLALVIPVAIGLAPAGIGPWAKRLRGPAIGLACALLAMTPWLVRDAVEFDRFVPVTTSGGISISGTYNQVSYSQGHTHGAWRDPQVVPGFRHLFEEPGRDEADVDAILRHDAISFAWDHPAYVASTSAWNLLRLFEIEGGSVVDSKGRPLDQRGVGSETPTSERIGLALAVLAALGGIAILLAARRRGRRTGQPPDPPSGPAFLWAVPIVMLAIAIPVAGVPRYRLPADPFILLLASIAAVSIVDAARRRREPAR